ncbi:NB-ARC domain-containing protein [Amycolatopsis keratiniphila]|uniref:NB-ARC domain-containing protein n=1 Tax=Amycolatopsis keratiniphila TaxID=129921 RepID=UPI00087AA8DA|nr:NB-ARC domain-containing protein [Amycolatopsis keratiniphila]SDU66811.1 NB-ARC domain-containing protein [Amycolatopsis keratiniphila]
MTDRNQDPLANPDEADPVMPTSYPSAAQQYGQRLFQLRTRHGLKVRDLEDRTREIVAARVAELRKHPKNANLTAPELEDLAGKPVSKSAISRIEKGKPPSVDAGKLLDEALNAQGTLEILAGPARAEPSGHLPVTPPYFVGRQSELGQLTRLTSQPPEHETPTVIVIGGLPGVGKSALALQWAHGMYARFDLVLYAALGGYTSGSPSTHAEILTDLLRGLSVERDHVPATEQQRETLLRDHLRRRKQQVLVLLDNARDSQQVKPLLTSLAGTTVVVTSRQELSGLVIDHNARTVRLDTLTDREACVLAADIIADDRVEAEPDAVAQLVDLCASLPLAILVAAERIAADPDTSIGEHVAALADVERRLQLLDIDESGGVRAAFEWSYRTLRPDTARMFRLLSLYPRPRVTTQAACALAGVTIDKGLRLLDDLAQAHLLHQVTIDSFHFHDLLRVYAAEQADQQPEDERHDAIVRLVTWFHHTVNAAAWALTPMRDHHVHLSPTPHQVTPLAFGDFTSAFTWCSTELSSLPAVARLGIDHGLYFETWRMAIDLFEYLVHSRTTELWITLMELAVEAAEKDGHTSRLAEAQEKLAEGYRRGGRIDDACEFDDRAARTAGARGPSRTLGFALLGLGKAAHTAGDLTEAFVLTRRALDVAVAAGTRIGEAMGHIALGSVYRDLTTRDLAIKHGEKAVTMFASVDDQHGVAVALLPLARTYLAFGLFGQALRACARAQEAYAATADRWGRADALGVNAEVLDRLGDHQAAAKCLREALPLLRGHDDGMAGRFADYLAGLENR